MKEDIWKQKYTFVLFFHAECRPLKLGINVMVNYWKRKTSLIKLTGCRAERKQAAVLKHNNQTKMMPEIRVYLSFYKLCAISE